MSEDSAEADMSDAEATSDDTSGTTSGATSGATSPIDAEQPAPTPEVVPAEPSAETPAPVTAAVIRPDEPAPEPADPSHGRLRQVLVTSLIVIVLVLLAGGAGAGLYYRSIVLPPMLDFPSTTTVYYADGTVLAELGEVRRTPVAPADLIDPVKQVAVAADDPDFWGDSGGPIVRTVARIVFDLRGTGLSARARTAVVARKLDGTYSKEDLLGYYLNDSAFGRTTYGIEAAAREYFGKSASRKAAKQSQLTTAEAMVLMAMVRQPEANPDDPQGSPGYDPTRGPVATANSKARFAEIGASLAALHYLSSADVAALTYPTTVKPYDQAARARQLDRPVGLVVNHVLSELTQDKRSQFAGRTWTDLTRGGLRIYTTIRPAVQESMEKAADARVTGSAMNGQPKNLAAAAVVVEPGTGRVLGYYGGPDGRGADYAGTFRDEKGELAGFGAHAPGNSFAVHTLAAALQAGISLNSRWQWTPHDMPGRTGTNQVRNTSVCPSIVDGSGGCSLLDAVTSSLDVVLYALTVSVTPAKVLEMARDAGVDALWTAGRERRDLTAITAMSAETPGKFDASVGIGRYAVTVLDQANAMATYGAGGLRANAHFVEKVLQGDAVVYGEFLPTPGQPRVVRAEAIADLDYALSRSPSAALDGMSSAGKTGVWALDDRVDQNTDAWMVGYTTKLATAVWIGNATQQQAIKDADGVTIWGSGLPAKIFRDTMTSAHKALNLKPDAFAPPVFVGTDSPPGALPGTVGAPTS